MPNNCKLCIKNIVFNLLLSDFFTKDHIIVSKQIIAIIMIVVVVVIVSSSSSSCE